MPRVANRSAWCGEAHERGPAMTRTPATRRQRSLEESGGWWRSGATTLIRQRPHIAAASPLFRTVVDPARAVSVRRPYLHGMATVSDRVEERRRAVQLARHYREAEGLSIAQIAQRLGRSPARSRRTSTTPPARRPRRSRPATRASAAAAAPPPSPATAKATPTPTASAATPAPPRRNGRANECATQCTRGVSDTGRRHRHMTGRAHTRADGARRRSPDSPKVTGPPPAPSPTSTAPGRPRTPTRPSRGHRDGRRASPPCP